MLEKDGRIGKGQFWRWRQITEQFKAGVMNAYWSQTGWALPRRIQPREDVGDRDRKREEAYGRADREGIGGETQRMKASQCLSTVLENDMDMISSRLNVLGI